MLWPFLFLVAKKYPLIAWCNAVISLWVMTYHAGYQEEYP